MSVRDDQIYLRHLLRAVERVDGYTEYLLDSQFAVYTMVQDAVAHEFRIIGRAAKGVNAAFRQQHPEIPWEHLARLEDLFADPCREFDTTLGWVTAREEFLPLLPLLKALV